MGSFETCRALFRRAMTLETWRIQAPSFYSGIPSAGPRQNRQHATVFGIMKGSPYFGFAALGSPDLIEQRTTLRVSLLVDLFPDLGEPVGGFLFESSHPFLVALLVMRFAIALGFRLKVGLLLTHGFPGILVRLLTLLLAVRLRSWG
jgi:hypothetical protein